MLQLHGQSEIAQLHHAIIGNKEVVRFDVLVITAHCHQYSMDDSLLVEIRQSQQAATNSKANLFLVHSVSTPHIRSKGSTLAILHHNLRIIKI